MLMGRSQHFASEASDVIAFLRFSGALCFGFAEAIKTVARAGRSRGIERGRRVPDTGIFSRLGRTSRLMSYHEYRGNGLPGIWNLNGPALTAAGFQHLIDLWF